MSNISEKQGSPELGLTFDESGLIRQIQTGKTAVFSELIARYQDRLYNLAWRLTGSAEDAADLAQETLTRAFKGIHQFRGNARFYTWLVRIMINITNDWKSKSKRDRDLRQQMQTILERTQAAGMADVQDPQLQAQNREMVDLLWQAIDVLDGPQKQVLLLRDLEQLSYEEIAQILKLTEGTIKSRLFRAREALRDLLAPVLSLKGGKEE
jgi:RNA polymerase sigma-70 factor (ECF subfamily)